ncbi:MAG: hyaluronate lyase, partial [Acidobacteria bacterium]
MIREEREGSMQKERPGRRTFIRTSAATAAGLTLSSVVPRGVLGANDRLRVGLIGGGGRGNYLLGETLKIAASHNVEVAALCDVWKVNLERTADRLAKEQGSRPKTFARYMDLLSMPGIDAVIIATPDFAHA